MLSLPAFNFPFSKDIIQVSKRVNKSIVIDFDALTNLVSKSGTNPIIFSSFFGKIGMGKTTAISKITGKLEYAIGDGISAETKDIFASGPYSLPMICGKFGLNVPQTSINHDVYFIDFPGFNVFENENKNFSINKDEAEYNSHALFDSNDSGQSLTQQLNDLMLSFLSVSQLVVFFANVNEGKTTTDFLKKNLRIEDISDVTKLEMLVAAINVGNQFGGVIYAAPDEKNTDEISSLIEESWYFLKSSELKYKILPLANVDSEKSFEESYKIFIKNYLSSLIEISQRPLRLDFQSIMSLLEMVHNSNTFPKFKFLFRELYSLENQETARRMNNVVFSP